MNVIIPTPEGNEQIHTEEVKNDYNYTEGMPVVYLLHGAYGNNTSWSRFSNIERYVQQYKCIAVMPSVQNSFYQDMYRGGKYYTFLTEELRNYVCNLFPASKDREKTFIAGFSMGGYGSFYLALKNPHIYAKAVSMSGAVDIYECYEKQKIGELDAPFEWENIFANPESIKDGEADLFSIIKNHRNKGVSLPKLYQACGKDDFLFGMNERSIGRFRELGVDIKYVADEGNHDWDYWDREIRRALAWIFEK